jgi:hypothetical protein
MFMERDEKCTRYLIEHSGGTIPLGKPKFRREDNINMDLAATWTGFIWFRTETSGQLL